MRRLAEAAAPGAPGRRALLQGRASAAQASLTVAPLAGAPGSACASAPEEREALVRALDRLRESPVCAALFDSGHDAAGASWGDAVADASALASADGSTAKSLAKARRQVQATQMAQQCSNPCLDDYARALFHAAFCADDAQDAGPETVQAFEMQCVRNEQGEFCMQAMAMVDESMDAAREEAADPCAQVRRTGCCFPTFLNFHGRLRGHLLHMRKSAGGAAEGGRPVAPEDLALDAEFGAAAEFFSECGLTGTALCPLDGKLNVTGFARAEADAPAAGSGWSGGDILAADLEGPSRPTSPEDPPRPTSLAGAMAEQASATPAAPSSPGASSGAFGPAAGLAVALAAAVAVAAPVLLAL